MIESLGKRLKWFRSQKRWTQGEVAEKLGLRGHSTYSNWEYDRTQPDAEMLSKLAGLFGVTVDELLGNVNKKNSPIYEPASQTEQIIKEIVDKYNLDLTIPGTREKLETIIKLVADDRANN